MSDILDKLWKERNDLRERVAELEQSNNALREIANDLKDQSADEYASHYSTNDQIDSAVKIAVNSPYEAAVKRTWNALNKLHIFKCEGCGGSGHLPPAITGHFKPLPGSKCPDCAKWGSKGWVIK